MDLLEGDPEARADAVGSAGRLYELISGFYLSRAIYAAAELGLADLLRDGPRDAISLAAETDTHPPSLARLLRLLASVGVLVEDGGAFALSAVGELLQSDATDSMRDVARLLAGPLAQRAWSGLLESLYTGEPSLDPSFFTYLAEHADEAAVYNRGIASLTRHLAPALLAGYDFSRFSTIVDVGGGQGELLINILTANEGPRGILLDLSAVVDGAWAPVAAAGLSDRCEIVGGDFLKEVPPDGDAYLLRGVILNWDDAHCVTILRNCRRAMAAGGRVLIVETVMPEHARPSAGLRAAAGVDVNQMVMLGGVERTLSQYARLLDESGFTLSAAITVGASPSGIARVHSVIEGTPR